MFISRFWTLLLAFTAVVFLAVVILAKDVVNRERLDNAKGLLSKELGKVDVAFTLHARKRLDILLSAAFDADVRKMMLDIARDDKKAEEHRQKLLTVLRQRNNEFKQYKADMLMAVDIHGRVVVQVGSAERKSGFSMSGFPVVDAALRGYVADDVWMLDNKIYLVAARPVIESRQYVGAIVHTMQITDALATELSPSVQLGFFAGNLMIANGKGKARDAKLAQSAYIGKPLDKVLADEKFKKDGYSDNQKIDTKDGIFMARYSLVHGEASQNGVGYAVILPVTQMTSFTEFYERAASQDIAQLPIVLLIIGLLLAIAIGWVANYIEAERPLTKLHKHILTVTDGDSKDQLNAYRFRRRNRKVAQAINKLIDARMEALMEEVGAGTNASKSIDAILGGKNGTDRLSSAAFKFVEPNSDDIPAPPPPTGPQSGPQTGPQIGGNKPPMPPITPGRGSNVSPMSPGVPAATMSPQEEKAYFQKIHADFVALKKQLGEPTEQLTFQRFEVTLKKNQDTLKARYGCQSVKFQVYEKDGKASLKATPVK